MVGESTSEKRRNVVKYMILMNATQANLGSFGSMRPEEIKAHIEFMHTLNAELRSSGEFVLAEGLTPPNEARIVRANAEGGKPIVSDGPFAETKEFLMGFWILECPNVERALALAARISTAPGGGGKPMNFPVEVRPVGTPPKV
jgi:hypothetical protein